MSGCRFTYTSRLPVSAEEAYAWHTRPGAFQRLLPPWQEVEVLSRTGGIDEGARVELRMRLGPLSVKWVAEHGPAIAGREFRDVQVRGPFASWEHVHRLEPDGPDACFLEDRVDYELPAKPLGRWLGKGWVEESLRQTFAYRHAVTRGDLAAHARYRDRGPERIVMTGGSGLLGGTLVPFLTAGGHEVIVARRPTSAGGADSAIWDPATGEIRDAGPNGFSAVVHLAGENIVGGRWTADKKRRIRESRVDATARLARFLSGLANPPRVLLCASATGYYGDRGDERLDETSPPGDGFLAGVCRQWEAATAPAAERGVRVVHLRFGIILSPRGGALAKMRIPFRLGLGGRVGSGEQYWSWIGIDDAAGVVYHAMRNDELRGAVNVVAPQAVTNRHFTGTLASVLARPAIAPVPAAVLRATLGEVADEMLLSSARVQPARLIGTGYAFRDAELEGALRHLLGRRRESAARSLGRRPLS